MFRKALIPDTKVVPAAGMIKIVGGPSFGQDVSGEAPPGWSSMPANIVARSTDMNVKNALIPASLASALNVRGMLAAHETTAMMALNPTVQRPPLLMVFRYLAPTRQ